MKLIKDILFVSKVYILFFFNKLETARQSCIKQIEFSKQPSRLYHALLGDVLKRLEQNALAITEYNIALKENKAHFTDYYNLISLYFRVENNEKVIELANKCLQQKFSFFQNILKQLYSSDIYWHLAQASARTQRYKLSIEYFEKYLPSSKKDRKDIYETLGYCYEKLGEYETAVVNYKKALSIDPTLAVSKDNLEQIYKEKPFLK